MNWDNVEMIRNAQASNQKRFDEEHIAVQEKIEKAIKSETFNQLAIPRMTELETMIFKMRAELIDYIVAHGLVDGLVWNGVLQPVENGKIVITKEMVELITEKLGYYKEDDVLRFIEQYLPEHNYVADGDYVHTDNNYTTEEKEKLAGIEDGAEVNKVIDIIFNGTSVLDDGTRVATITITPEDIKRWYESNADTNCFADADKAKLAGISDGAEVNRVDDVIVNGRSVLNDKKQALITKEVVKEAYEANDDTNCFTDAEKERLADIHSLRAFVSDANAIKDLEREEFGAFGIYSTTLGVTVTLTDGDGKTQKNSVYLNGYAVFDASDEISGSDVLLTYINPNADTEGLASITIAGTKDLDIIACVNVNADNFHAVSASIEYTYIHRTPANVLGVTVDGESVMQSNGIANVRSVDVSGLVPYQGAVKQVDLNTQPVLAGSYQTQDPSSTYKDDVITVDKHCISLVSDYTRGDAWGMPIAFGMSNAYPLVDIRIGPGKAFGVYKHSLEENPSGSTVEKSRYPFVVGEPTKDYHATTKTYVDTHGINTYTATIGKGLVSAITGATNRFDIDATINIDVTYKNSDGTSNDASFMVGGVLQIDKNGLVYENQTLLPIDANATALKVVEATITNATDSSTTVSIKVNDAWLSVSITNIYFASSTTLSYSEADGNNGIQFYNNKQPARIITETPIDDGHAANKKYVDDAIAGGASGKDGTTFTPSIEAISSGDKTGYRMSWTNDGEKANPNPVEWFNGLDGSSGSSSALVECEQGEEDIRIVDITTGPLTLTGKLLTTQFSISDGAITGADSNTSKTIRLYSGQRIIFARYYNSSASAWEYRSVNPVSGSALYLVYDVSKPNVFRYHAAGVTYASTETFNLVTATESSITTGDISASSTSKYYKFQ